MPSHCRWPSGRDQGTARVATDRGSSGCRLPALRQGLQHCSPQPSPRQTSRARSRRAAAGLRAVLRGPGSTLRLSPPRGGHPSIDTGLLSTLLEHLGNGTASTRAASAGDGLGPKGAALRRGGDGDTRPVPHTGRGDRGTCDDRRAGQPALGGRREGVRSPHPGEEKGLGSPSQPPGCKGQPQGQGQLSLDKDRHGEDTGQRVQVALSKASSR